MSFTNALTIVFVVLKLCGVIDWSWWFVLLPTIILLGFLSVIGALTLFLEN